VTAFNLEFVGLRSTNDAIAEAARLSVEQQLQTNSSLRPTALRQLTAYEVSRKAIAEAIVYSKQVVGDPAANYVDKLDHLGLLHKEPTRSWIRGCCS